MAGPAKKAPALSLYADLLNADKQGATISGAPVKYDVKRDGAEETQKKKDASLKFQPIKRPQVQQKSKPRGPPPTSSSAHKFSSSVTAASGDDSASKSTPYQPPKIQRSNIEDWMGDDDDGFYYQDRHRERGGRKKNKKKNKAQETPTWDWDDIYDPTRPNSYADYKGSEEQYREVRDWKARLYYRQLKEAKKQGRSQRKKDSNGAKPLNKMFAPPSQMSFAPPTFVDDDQPPPPPLMDDTEDSDSYFPPPAQSDRPTPNRPVHFPPQPAPSLSDDATGEDAYMRRMRMSQAASSPAATTDVHTPPAQIAQPAPGIDMDAKRAAAMAKIAAFKAKLSKPPPKPDAATASASPPDSGHTIQATPIETHTDIVAPAPSLTEDAGATISRAPVRYDAPPTLGKESEDEEIPTAPSEAEAEPRSNRPGKKGFAERMLKKYGWEKGQGLGAQGDGITTALFGKADKRKKRSDAEGGGWAQPANMGKIVGGKRRKIDDASGDSEQDARFGALSSVIKLEGMLVGLDVQHEIENNNLMQEIGDEMGGQYGNVERVFIWREENGGDNAVFVKFNSQLSAVRAVNDTDGMTFADNQVSARFWDEDRFEKGEYA